MTPSQKRRMYMVLGILVGVGVSVAFALQAFNALLPRGEFFLRGTAEAFKRRDLGFQRHHRRGLHFELVNGGIQRLAFDTQLRLKLVEAVGMHLG